MTSLPPVVSSLPPVVAVSENEFTERQRDMDMDMDIEVDIDEDGEWRICADNSERPPNEMLFVCLFVCCRGLIRVRVSK